MSRHQSGRSEELFAVLCFNVVNYTAGLRVGFGSSLMATEHFLFYFMEYGSFKRNSMQTLNPHVCSALVDRLNLEEYI